MGWLCGQGPVNDVYRDGEYMGEFQDILMDDFTQREFCQVFQLYFQELGLAVKDWDALFQEMNSDGRENRAFVRKDGGQTVGFIQFCPMELASWFFTQRVGFVREFWVAPAYRGHGHGAQLLTQAENWFIGMDIHRILLTTDTVPGFYEHMGYHLDKSFKANNHDMVYVKEM